MGSLFVIICAFGPGCLLPRPSVPESQSATLQYCSLSGLKVTFIGTSTLLFESKKAGESIWIDGFVSRPALTEVLSAPLEPDLKTLSRVVSRTGVRQSLGIFVSHSHYDHLLDAPALGKKLNSPVFGSLSTQRVCWASGQEPSLCRRLKNEFKQRLGEFFVTSISTPHSPNPAYSGEIVDAPQLPMRVDGYQEGGNSSFLIQWKEQKILVVPSANFKRGAFRDRTASHVFLGMGGLSSQSTEFIEDYWKESVEALKAKCVLPIHWDDFTQPLFDEQGRPQKLLPFPFLVDNLNWTAGVLNRLAKQSDVHVLWLDAFQSLD